MNNYSHLRRFQVLGLSTFLSLALCIPALADPPNTTALCLKGYAWRGWEVFQRTIYVRGLLDAIAWEDGTAASRCSKVHCDLGEVIDGIEPVYQIRPAYRIVPIQAVLVVAIDRVSGSLTEAQVATTMDGL